MSFHGSHTVEQIRLKFEVFNQWEITEDQAYLVLCDNGSNMANAFTDASLPHLGDLHTLPLAVHGVFCHREQ